MTPANAQTEAELPETMGMLRSLKHLEGYKIAAKDGNIGKLHDFLFDDEFWIVRYVVVDTGQWLPGRKVLLTPRVLQDPDWRKHTFSVGLTCEQVKTSPAIDTDKPVSRQREQELHAHFGWPVYWPAEGAWPGMVMPPADIGRQPETKSTGDPHLRSVREVAGYAIAAQDGDIGAADDFIADDQTWPLRYLVVSTHKWLPGRKVLIAPEWLVGPIDWASRKVKVSMSRSAIKNSPGFEPAAPINRQYETRLYDYYGRPHYWT